MESELKASLPTLKERKKLLGFSTMDDFGHPRKRPSEDPFPLRGGTEIKVKPKQFSTLPRKPKRRRMSDKPPLAPKPPLGNTPPIPKPRKKGPPPIKPVPYLKHKEHKKDDVSTFKSNLPLGPSANKPPPPLVAEKPPRRNSAKGEPSSEFYKPKRTEPAPIQYGIPSVPFRNKTAVTDSRPRLDTPLNPPEPVPQALSNGSEVIEASNVSTNSMEVYSQVEDGVTENGKEEEEEGYAAVSPTRMAARLPKPAPLSVPRQTPPPRTPTPVSPRPPPLSPKPPPSPQVEQAQSPATLSQELEGHSFPLPIKKADPVPPAVKPEPVSPRPKPLPPARKVEPVQNFPGPAAVPPNEYSVTVHAISPTPHKDGYSPLNRPDSASSSPAHHVTPEYSVVDVSPLSPPPPLAGNPTQQSGYSQLEVSAPELEQDNEYAVINSEPIRNVPEEMVPKVKAKNASMKVKSGSVQLQTARNRSDFSSYAEDMVLISPKPRRGKPPPPAKPTRPPLMYEKTEIVMKPSTERALSPLSNKDLERSGYETVNTLGTDPDVGEPGEPPQDDLSEDQQFMLSPKVEVDIDYIRQMNSELDDESAGDNPQTQESDEVTMPSMSHGEMETVVSPEDPQAGLVLHSPDFFIVPQHAVPGALGYCEVDVLPLDQQRPPDTQPPDQQGPLNEGQEAVGAGVVEGDSVTVKHNSYPDAEGYCNLSSTGSPQHTATAAGALYSDVNDRGVADPRPSSGGGAEYGDQELDTCGYRDESVKSSAHTYEVVSNSPQTLNKPAGASPPTVKPKPKRVSSESVDTETPPTEDGTKALVSPKRKKSRPRRAPPPPPPKAADDNVLTKRPPAPPRVAGDFATLPRGQRSLTSPQSPPTSIDARFEESVKIKPLSAKSPSSPKHSPKGLKKIFRKPFSSSPDTARKGSWRKKSVRGGKRDESVVTAADKTRSLPGTGRTQRELPIPTLDSNENVDEDMYATIAETLNRPSSAASAVPPKETKRTSSGNKDLEPYSKRRASFRNKKEKIQKLIRKSNSAEHLYDSADKQNNRARLPNPDEVHAGLYAMVTSKPKATEQVAETTPPPLPEPFNGHTQSPPRNSASPSKCSLYEREGIVVTSLDDKFGTKDSEETFVSSADIEHTVSSEGSVYAIVQSRPSKKKKSTSLTIEEEEGQSLEPQSDLSHGPKKPPRSPSLQPPPYQKKNSTSETPPASVSSEIAAVIEDQPVKAGSGPPSFPPPPPPMAKSVSPEPEAVGENPDDPAYEVVSASKKKQKAPPKKPSKPLIQTEEVVDGEGLYSVVAESPSAGGVNTLGSNDSPQEMVHIDSVLRSLDLDTHRPAHLYSTIREGEEVGGTGTVSVPMVSHGYATVSDKARTGKMNGHVGKKKQAGSPRLPPRTKPPPPPPGEGKGQTGAHKPVSTLMSSPLELDGEPGVDSVRTKRTHSIGSRRAEQDSQPKFLFSQKLCQSLIAVGDSPDTTTSPCLSTSTLASMEDDSDGDIVYSTEWDSSTDGENEHETIHRPKTFYIAREILTTERTFVKGLKLLDKDFRQAVRSANNAHDKPVIPDDVMKLIMGNVSSLLSLNSDMLQDLEERMCQWDEDPRIGDILKIRAPYLKIYSEYISKFDKALKTLDEWTKKSPQFAEVVHEFEAQPKCASIPIAGYMLDIVQRITRYKLLMADYVKHLPDDSNDREDSERALEFISSTATHVNETIRQMDNFRKVVEVRKKLIGDAGDTLITPYRKLLKEGELLKFSRKEKQPRMFFLFNDILIYASSIPPANTTYRVIKRIPLEGMRVEPLDDPEMKYGFQIVSTCKSFRLDASNREEKTQWLTAFEAAIKEHVERTKNREKARQLAEGADKTDSVPLGHLAPPWLPDSVVSMCQLCSVTFTVTRRRHHCRACGMIFCSDCSNYYAPLKYMNNKSERVCQSCYGKICKSDDGVERSPQKRPGRLSRGHNKMVSMPSVLREVKARDQSAQVSGYLHSHTSKSKRWKKRWYVVYNLALYEFEKHEDVSAKRSITLPSYAVISPVPRHDDPLVFVLKHDGTGKEYFKAENEDQLEKWIDVLTKAVRGEVDQLQSVIEEPAANTTSPEEPTSPHSLDSSSS